MLAFNVDVDLIKLYQVAHKYVQCGHIFPVIIFWGLSRKKRCCWCCWCWMLLMRHFIHIINWFWLREITANLPKIANNLEWHKLIEWRGMRREQGKKLVIGGGGIGDGHWAKAETRKHSLMYLIDTIEGEWPFGAVPDSSILIHFSRWPPPYPNYSSRG